MCHAKACCTHEQEMPRRPCSSQVAALQYEILKYYQGTGKVRVKILRDFSVACSKACWCALAQALWIVGPADAISLMAMQHSHLLKRHCVGQSMVLSWSSKRKEGAKRKEKQREGKGTDLQEGPLCILAHAKAR